MNWHLLSQKHVSTIEELTQVLRENRNLLSDDSFFKPKSPFEVSVNQVDINPGQLQMALERIHTAILNKQSIVVFGDYDADGVCATAVLWQTLHDLGAQVIPFIPHREKHGYGISDRSLDDLLAESQPDLIITVDNGIVAHKPAQRLQQLGVDLIITDHHQPEEILPEAIAIVQTDHLCGTTLAWMVSRELVAYMTSNNNQSQSDIEKSTHDFKTRLTKTLDLCGIATIADQVVLMGANRSFAAHGIAALRSTKRPGLLALFEQAHINQQEISSQSIGFGIAPRINAMGRLGDSLDALRLLLTTSKTRAQQLAQQLNQTNTERQELTYQMMDEAMLGKDTWENEHLIIVSSTEYHEGVIGLIAGRLTEKFYKPSIAMSISETVVKASARSVPGVNIIELIRQVKDDLLEVGGHPMAAGFGLEVSKLDLVVSRLQSLAKAQIDQKLLEPTVEVEAVIDPKLLTLETVETLDTFAPFGSGNEQPILGMRDITVLEVITMGKENKHLKVIGQVGEEIQPLNFLAWRRGFLETQIKPGDTIDVAGVLELNEWRNRKTLQVRVVDVVRQP